MPIEAPSVADEVARGDGMSLADAACLFPPLREGRKVHPATILRWITSGVRTADDRTVKLEGIRLGCRWLTTRAAVARFINDQQPRPAGQTPAAHPTRREEAVERELVELGV